MKLSNIPQATSAFALFYKGLALLGNTHHFHPVLYTATPPRVLLLKPLSIPWTSRLSLKEHPDQTALAMGLIPWHIVSATVHFSIRISAPPPAHATSPSWPQHTQLPGFSSQLALSWVACLHLQVGLVSLFCRFFLRILHKLVLAPACDSVDSAVYLSLPTVSPLYGGGAWCLFSSDTTRGARAQGQTELHKHGGFVKYIKSTRKSHFFDDTPQFAQVQSIDVLKNLT